MGEGVGGNGVHEGSDVNNSRMLSSIKNRGENKSVNRENVIDI